jgi:Ca2+-transporting ATPase
MKGGVSLETIDMTIVEEMPFDSDRKLMSVLLRDDAGRCFQYTKGAPEGILARCDSQRHGDRVTVLTDAQRNEILLASSGMADRALRVLALAERDDIAGNIDEAHLTFVGLVGMIDPPRPEAKQAVRRCRDAGIRPVMITGDHPSTAQAIARELGIAAESDQALTGQQLDSTSDQELAANVERYSVYARVAPEHKLRVVRAWQSRGEIVAMTGDGVNDAPAVKTADIGVAMGLTGTDVTRESSAMVLLDDNFATIVNAVEEGRTIYDNIQKFLIFLLSCNAGELLLMLFASILGWPVPLLPVQLLWINLITDGLPALALAMEPPEPGVMSRRPRPSRELILSWGLGATCVFQGLLLAAVGLIAFGLFQGMSAAHVDLARSVTFSVVVLGELFRSFAARSRTWTFWELGPLTNVYLVAAVAFSAILQAVIILIPALHPVFETRPHGLSIWAVLVLIVLALTPMMTIELIKLGRRGFSRGLSDKNRHATDATR